MLEPQAPETVLIILHQAHSTPGRVGRLLRQAGYTLDIRRPALGDALPRTLREHTGVVMFGGPMSANDPDEWIGKEISWLAAPLAEEKPFLGLCLGAQMLAKHLGARVFNHDDRRCKAGYYQIHPTAAGDALCPAPFPRHAYHWHGDGFELPHGAQLLAQGCQNFPYQAFRYGRAALALQFHPEVTYQMMCRWTTRGAERLLRPGAKPQQEHLNGWYLYDRHVGHWLDQLLSRWVQNALPPIEKMNPQQGATHRTALMPAAASPEL